MYNIGLGENTVLLLLILLLQESLFVFAVSLAHFNLLKRSEEPNLPVAVQVELLHWC